MRTTSVPIFFSPFIAYYLFCICPIKVLRSPAKKLNLRFSAENRSERRGSLFAPSEAKGIEHVDWLKGQ